MRNITMFITLLAALLLIGAGPAQTPELKTLIECSDQAWVAMIKGWSDYAFDRHVTRRSLDEDGKETFLQEMHFRLTPLNDGFDEKLLKIDGKPPTPGELKEHRKKARFTKHFKQAENLELDNPLGENLALLPILREQEYRIVGQEEVNGVPCHKVVFDARPEPEGKDIRQKLQYAIKGSAHFTIDGCHLVDFTMETVRPLKETPITLKYLQLSFTGQPVEGGWMLHTADLKSDVVVLGAHMRKFNTYRYSNFSRQN